MWETLLFLLCCAIFIASVISIGRRIDTAADDDS